MTKENCSKRDLIVQVKSRRISRFKAGAELSSNVSLVAVDFNEESTEDSELMEVKITLTSEACAEESSCED